MIDNYPDDPNDVRTDGAPYLGPDRNGWYCYDAPFSVGTGRTDDTGEEIRFTFPHQRLTPNAHLNGMNSWVGGYLSQPGGPFLTDVPAS